MHGMFYSSDPAATRAFFKDVMGFDHFDAGGGWLIFNIPQADLGVHPNDYAEAPPSGTAEISFFVDDIHGTVAELKAKGATFTGDVRDDGFGYTIMMQVPGGVKVMLYEAKYGRG